MFRGLPVWLCISVPLSSFLAGAYIVVELGGAEKSGQASEEVANLATFIFDIKGDTALEVKTLISNEEFSVIEDHGWFKDPHWWNYGLL